MVVKRNLLIYAVLHIRFHNGIEISGCKVADVDCLSDHAQKTYTKNDFLLVINATSKL